MKNPRSLAVVESNGTVIVYASSNGAGVVTAIVNSTGTPKACTLIKNLNNPEGLVYTNGSLFIGQATHFISSKLWICTIVGQHACFSYELPYPIRVVTNSFQDQAVVDTLAAMAVTALVTCQFCLA